MDRFYRYLNLFKNAKFGMNMPKGSLLNYAKTHLGMLNEYLGENGVYPPMTTVNISKRCNLKCSFCIFSKFPHNYKKSELTPPMFEKILSLDIVKKSILLNLSGGEPLLNTDILEVIKMARKRKHLVAMISNGLLLGKFDYGAALKEAGLCDAQISVYENTKDELLEILLKASKHISICASYVLLKSHLYREKESDFNGLILMLAKLAQVGCQSIKFNICEADYISNDSSETLFEKDSSVYEEFIEKCKEKLPNFCYTGHKSGWHFPTKRFTVFFPQTVHKTSERCCRIPWNLIIDANGGYTPCCRLQPILNIECGNLFADAEAVNTLEYRQLRKALLDKNFPLSKHCINCTYLRKTYGGQI